LSSLEKVLIINYDGQLKSMAKDVYEFRCHLLPLVTSQPFCRGQYFKNYGMC